MPRRSPHYIVFGARNMCDKAVVIGPSRTLGGYECSIVSLLPREKYACGDEVEVADINGIFTTLYFTKLECLKSFANSINKAVEMWEGGIK